MTLFLSLGAGVKSSCLALMYSRGELANMPAAAIFADTQAEPPSVYKWLDGLEPRLAFPLYRVTAGNLADAACQVRTSSKGRNYLKTAIPVFFNAGQGRGKRQCTSDYKIVVIQRKARELAGQEPIQMAIGISLDEVVRAKPSRHKAITNVFPLLFEKRMRRADCEDWMARQGYPPAPRSACVFCPFHADREWLHLRDTEPEAFAEAVAFEHRYQAAWMQKGNARSVPFLHRSGQSLDKVNLEPITQPSLWDDECEGYCGV